MQNILFYFIIVNKFNFNAKFGVKYYYATNFPDFPCYQKSKWHNLGACYVLLQILRLTVGHSYFWSKES